MSAPERVSNKYSLHETEKPELCPAGNHPHWRTLVCDSSRDIVECSRCGAQRETACNFDEEYA